MRQKIHVNMNMETIGKMDGEEMNSLVAYIKEVSVTCNCVFLSVHRRFLARVS